MGYTAETVIDAIAGALRSLEAMLAADSVWLYQVAHESHHDLRATKVWLGQWLESLTPEAMGRLVASASRPLGRGRLTTLAPGNVPIVAAECLLVGLLAGVKHQLLLSTRSTVLVQVLAESLRARMADFDRRVSIGVFRRMSPAARQAVFAKAERVCIYGAAPTLEWVARQAPPAARLVPHGPSQAMAYVEPEAMTDEALDRALLGLARDLAAWDQRGCRSPQLLAVRGGGQAVRAVVQALVERHLPRVEAETPRGSQTEGEVAAGFLDGITSAALGEVFSGAGWRVTVGNTLPAPMGRTLRVVGVGGGEELGGLMAQAVIPVGLVGVPEGAVEEFAGRTTLAGLAGPEVVPLGTLQRPPFDRLHDGRHRLDELVPPIDDTEIEG